MRNWLVWRGTVAALVRAPSATEARRQAHDLFDRGLRRRGRSFDGLVVRRASRADVEAFNRARAQVGAGAATCRVPA